MYVVKCKSPGRGHKWQEYSRPFHTVAEAEAVKQYGENTGTLSINGETIQFRIFKTEDT